MHEGTSVSFLGKWHQWHQWHPQAARCGQCHWLSDPRSMSSTDLFAGFGGPAGAAGSCRLTALLSGGSSGTTMTSAGPRANDFARGSPRSAGRGGSAFAISAGGVASARRAGAANENEEVKVGDAAAVDAAGAAVAAAVRRPPGAAVVALGDRLLSSLAIRSCRDASGKPNPTFSSRVHTGLGARTLGFR